VVVVVIDVVVAVIVVVVDSLVVVDDDNVIVDDVPDVGNDVVEREVAVAIVVVVDSLAVVNDDNVIADDVVEGEVAVVIVEPTVVSDFSGLKITNFNNKEKVTTTIAKTIKEMKMIQRRCRSLGRFLFPVSLSPYARLLYILCFTIDFNLKQKINSYSELLFICLLLT
jgi:hypothetical protein